MSAIVKIVFVAVILLFQSPAGAFSGIENDQQKNKPSKEIESCFIRAVSDRANCLTLSVPLDYTNPDLGTIEIFAAVLPAKSGKSEPDPLVFFTGGPGQSAVESASFAVSILGSIWQDRDIVFIDQRGTGKSTPLDCDVADDVLTPEQQKEAVVACHDALDVRTEYFHLENSVHDFGLMIEALGYDRVNIYGISYGTRSAAHFYRRYPEMVRSIVVDAVAPPDYTLVSKAPGAAEDALRSLVTECLANTACAEAYPDLEDSIDSYINAARRGDLRYQHKNPLTLEEIDIPVTDIIAVESIRGVLYNMQSSIFLPYTITQAAQGNLVPIFSQIFSENRFGKMYLGMTLSFLCSEEVSKVSPQQAARWGENSFAGDTFYRNFANMCSVWPHTQASTLPQDMFEPWSGDVPLLALSGALDPITPPSGGAHIVSTLSNARHIVAPGTGHGTIGVGCMTYLVGKFLEDLDPQSLKIDCLDNIKRPIFVIGPNGQTGSFSIDSSASSASRETSLLESFSEEKLLGESAAEKGEQP